MAYASTPQGILYPVLGHVAYGASSGIVLDATGEMMAMIGHLYIDGRAASKTLDTTGSSAIQFRTGTVTFADAGTTLDIGIQDVSTSAGPQGQPDGTFDVKVTLTGGGGRLTTDAWNSIALTTGGTGTKTMSHGDLIAVTWDMTARAGTDTVSVIRTNTGASGGRPSVNTNLGGAGWQTTGTSNASPNVVITFSDGTLGTISGSIPVSADVTETFQDSTNPDERAIVFQVPWKCKIDALFALCGTTTGANADFTIRLYSDPLGTPTEMAAVAVLAEQWGTGHVTQTRAFFQLASEVELSANTNYAVAIRATGTSTARLGGLTIGDAAHRAFYPGGTTVSKYTRDGGAGAFGSQSTTTIYQMGVRISQLDDGAGGAAGMLRHPGMSGGLI